MEEINNLNLQETPEANQTTRVLEKNIYKYLFLASSVLLLAVIVILSLTLKQASLQKLSNQKTVPTISEQPEGSIPAASYFVQIATSDGPKKIYIETREMIADEEEIKLNSLTMDGLPKEYKNSKTSLDNYIKLRSKDGSKIIVGSLVYDETAKPSAFDGSLPVISNEEFICDVGTNKCEKTIIIPSIKDDRPVYWAKWDSQKGLLYGHLSGEGIGNASPVYVYDIKNKSLKETIGYNFFVDSGIFARVPTGFLSPSYTQFVMFTNEKNEGLKMLLFSVNDLSKPQKTIKLKFSPLENYDGMTYSVAWFNDEKRIALMTEKQVYVLNTETEELSLKYTDQEKNNSLIWFDFNKIVLTPDQKYLVFVDYIKKQQSDSNQSNEVLKAINLNNGEITEILYGKNFHLKYGL